MSDRYKNFQELTEHNRAGVDFEIETENRHSPISVIAIHGGNIEPATREIAKAISDNKFSYYSFVGKKSEKECEALHITSANFDEPQCQNLVSKSFKTISIHGMAENADFVMVGGLDQDLIQEIDQLLIVNNFNTKIAPENVNGNSTKNICNKCGSKMGIQLEIGRGYRDKFLADQFELERFSKVIRDAIDITLSHIA